MPEGEASEMPMWRKAFNSLMGVARRVKNDPDRQAAIISDLPDHERREILNGLQQLADDPALCEEAARMVNRAHSNSKVGPVLDGHKVQAELDGILGKIKK